MASEKREIEIALRSKSAEASADRLNTKVKNVGRTADGAESSMRSLTKVAAAVGAALATSRVVQYADAWTKVNNQIRQATNSTNEALAVQEAIFQIAKSSRVELGGVADAYQRIYNSVREFGFGAGDTLDVVEGLTKAFKANGASAQEVASVLVQLGQGLGAGALQGEELRAILEASLPVSRAIAKEFGVQVGQLKALGAEGQLVTDRVFKALQNSLPEFQSSFDKAAATVADGMSVAGNSITRLIGLTSEATGASQSFANGLIELSESIDRLGDAVESGAAGKIADVFKAQLQQIANDITQTTSFIFDDWETTSGALRASTDATTSFIGDAFLNIIPNIRQLVQVITVEIAAAVDKLAVYGEAVVNTLNPFDDIDVDQARGLFDKQLDQIDEIRESSLQSIFDQRQAEKTAQSERIAEAKQLIEVYKQQREARSLTFSDSSVPQTAGISTPSPKVSKSAKGEDFLSRLQLETQQLQAELEIRRQLNEGYITDKQASDAIELQAIYYNYEARRQAILEQEFQTAALKQEALNELREQELAAARNFQARLTAEEQAGSDKRKEILTLEQMQRKSMLVDTLVSAFNLTQNANQEMTKEQKKQAKRSVYINTAAAIARAYGENNFYVASAMAVFLAGMQLKQINAIDTASGTSPSGGSPSSASPSNSISTPSVDNQSQTRTINITGLDGFDDDQPIPLTVGGLKSLLSSNEDVNIAINQGQQNAQRVGAI